VIKVIAAWGDSGIGKGQLLQPYKIAIDDSGYVYVVDKGKTRVQKFTIAGVFVSQFADTFNQINDICTDKTNDVFIADFMAYKILKYNGNGTFVFSMGNSTEQYNGVTIDGNGSIYVLSLINNQGFIRQYDSLGKTGKSWQTNQGDLAMCLGIDSSVFTCGRNFITAFSRNSGLMLFSWTAMNGTVSTHHFNDIKVASNGAIIISDIESDQILVISANGSLLTKGGAFADLTGLAMDKNGNLYGAESGKNRIVKIKY
jgi:sugar lactone lactonase YvrE